MTWTPPGENSWIRAWDKMQNISTLIRKRSKSEGRAFWNVFKWNWFKPSSKILLLTVPGAGTSLVDHLCYLCLVFVMLSRLIIAALWSPAGKGLTSWLSFVVLNCVIVTFSFGILGRRVTWLYRFLISAPFLTFILYAKYYIYRLFCPVSRS